MCRAAKALRAWQGPSERMGLAIVARGLRCAACDDTFFDLHEMGRQAREIASVFVQRGIRTGRELKFVRKTAGLRAIDLAALLDVRAETVSRWERDEQPIPRQSAYIVGQLLEHPKQTRRRLEVIAS